MTTLEKLGILGIRSFAPDHLEVLSFEKPLTLIVGHNGAGKTTVVECLRMCTTGELPPNANKGHSFVHNPPQLTAVPEIKGQIRLVFKMRNGQSALANRSYQLLNTKDRSGRTKTSFKALESVVQIKDANGETHSINKKCAEIDQQIPLLMGISKSILDNVIFCHQEESNWPLMEMAKLKKKFDDLFGSTRYSRALEQLSAIRKEHQKIGKEKVHAVQLLHADLERRTSLEAGVARIQAKLTELQERSAAADAALATRREVLASLERRQKAQREQVLAARVLEQKMTDAAAAVQAEAARLGPALCPDPEDQLRSVAAEVEERLLRQRADAEACRNACTECERDLDRLRAELTELQQVSAAAIRAEERFALTQERKQELLSRIRAEYPGAAERVNDLLAEVARQRAGAEQVPAGGEKAASDGLVRRIAAVLEAARTGVAAAEAERAAREAAAREEELAALAAEVNQAAAALAVAEQVIDAKERALAALGAGPEPEEVERELQAAEAELAAVGSADGRQQLAEKVKDLEAALASARQRQARANAALVDCAAAVARAESASGAASARAALARARDALAAAAAAAREELGGPAAAAAPPAELAALLELRGAEARRAENAAQRAAERTAVADAEIRAATARAEAVKAEWDGVRAAVEAAAAAAGGGGGGAGGGGVATAASGGGGGDAAAADSAARCGGPGAAVAAQQRDVDRLRRELLVAQNAHLLYTNFLAYSEEKKRCALCARHFSTEAEIETMKRGLANKMAKLPATIARNEATYAQAKERLAELEAAEAKLAPLQRDLVRLRVDLDRAEAELAQKLRSLGPLAKASDDAAGAAEAARARAAAAAALAADLRRLAAEADRAAADCASHGSADAGDSASASDASAERARRASLENALRKIEAEIAADEGALRTLRSELDGQSAQRSRLSALVGDLGASLAASRQRGELRAALRQLRADAAGAREALAAREAARAAAAGAAAAAAAARARAEGALAAAADAARAAAAAVAAAEAQLAECAAARAAGAGAAARLAALENRRAEADAALAAQRAFQRRLATATTEAETLRGEVAASLRVRAMEAEVEEMRHRIVEAKAALGDFDTADADLAAAAADVSRLTAESAHLQGELKAATAWLDTQAADLVRYADTPARYREALIETETELMVIRDLGRYHAALDKALMRYHSIKMEEINRTMRRLWTTVYKGADIDFIQIRSDTDEERGAAGAAALSGQRSYNYRVTMRLRDSGDECEMRGRCSAGQKVLASLIVRLAIAESFCVDCGIMALDEPTTNLDFANKEALAKALSELIEERRACQHFQLILITHDEDFARLICRKHCCDNFYLVAKDERGNSTIRKADMRFF